ncbi:MAG: hypothetical protein IT291_11095 [Deltaproteobacteria bacterium]|nr:hypothetical protein [Deltaproteobacteria bacterium]
MNKKVVLALSAIALFAAFFWTKDYCLKRITDSLEVYNTAHNNAFAFDEIDVEFPFSLKFKRASYVLPANQINIPIVVDDGTIKPSLLSLAKLSPTIIGTLLTYNGKVDFSWSKPFRDDDTHLKVEASNLDLASHPALKLLGVNGKVHATFDSAISYSNFGSNIPRISNLEVLLEDCSMIPHPELKSFMPIPDIRDLSARLVIGQSGESISLEKLLLKSSLGSIVGKGVAQLKTRVQTSLPRQPNPLNQFEEIKTDFLIKLSTEGEKQLGGYLSLLAGIPIDQHVNSWRLEIDKKPELEAKYSLMPHYTARLAVDR